MTNSERAYHHGNLRRALLDAAWELLPQGIDAITLRAVARLAGVSHAAPYKHFADKTALLTELALMGFERLKQALRLAATGGDGGIGGAFAAMARAYLENKRDGWSATHYDREARSLEKDLYPYLGHRPIGEVEPPELLRACERIQDRDAVESAHRLLTTASGVWQFAIAKGYATRDIVPA